MAVLLLLTHPNTQTSDQFNPLNACVDPFAWQFVSESFGLTIHARSGSAGWRPAICCRSYQGATDALLRELNGGLCKERKTLTCISDPKLQRVLALDSLLQGSDGPQTPPRYLIHKPQ